MIESFADKMTAAVFTGHAVRGLCFVWRDGNAWDVEIVDYH